MASSASGRASATPEKGEATLDHRVGCLLDAFEEIARVPLSRVENDPECQAGAVV